MTRVRVSVCPPVSRSRPCARPWSGTCGSGRRWRCCCGGCCGETPKPDSILIPTPIPPRPRPHTPLSPAAPFLTLTPLLSSPFPNPNPRGGSPHQNAMGHPHSAPQKPPMGSAIPTPQLLYLQIPPSPFSSPNSHNLSGPLSPHPTLSNPTRGHLPTPLPFGVTPFPPHCREVMMRRPHNVLEFAAGGGTPGDPTAIKGTVTAPECKGTPVEQWGWGGRIRGMVTAGPNPFRDSNTPKPGGAFEEHHQGVWGAVGPFRDRDIKVWGAHDGTVAPGCKRALGQRHRGVWGNYLGAAPPKRTDPFGDSITEHGAPTHCRVLHGPRAAAEDSGSAGDPTAAAVMATPRVTQQGQEPGACGAVCPTAALGLWCCQRCHSTSRSPLESAPENPFEVTPKTLLPSRVTS